MSSQSDSPLRGQQTEQGQKHFTFGTVCAVVVTYNIGNAFHSRFNSLKGQVDHVILVNTSTDGDVTIRALQQLRDEDPEFVELIESPENNLGMAQNLGISKAIQDGYDWVLLLDHDSRLHAGMITAMEYALSRISNPLQVGLIAPYYEEENIDNPPHYLKSSGHYWFKQVEFDIKTKAIMDVLCVPASGSLISARVLDDTMPMDETFVIDHIDTDFCLRLANKGYQIMAVRDAKMQHATGNKRKHSLLGKSVTVTHHSPLRRYYLTRNRITVWKRHARYQPGFFIFDFMRFVYEWWRILLFEKEKNQKLAAIMRGLIDGFRGRIGPKPGVDIERDPAIRTSTRI